MNEGDLSETRSSILAGGYLTFNIEGEIYGLPILKAQEIIRMMKITNVPRTPPFIMGVVNLRGKVIPVVNVRLKFGMEKAEDTERTCIIVTEVCSVGERFTVGIVVDNVCEVLNLKPEQLSKTPPMGAHVDMEFIMGMGRLEDKVVMLLDLDKLFSKEELSALETN